MGSQLPPFSGKSRVVVNGVSQALAKILGDARLSTDRMIADSGQAYSDLTVGSANLFHLSRVKFNTGRNPSSASRILYWNGHIVAGTGEVACPNDITIQAATEVPKYSASIQRFFNGRKSITLEPGAFAFSDPLGYDFDPGEVGYHRTLVSVADSAKVMPVGTHPYVDTGQRAAAYPTDPGTLLGTGAITFGSGQTLSTHPIMMIGRSAYQPAWGIWPDSIGTGLGDIVGSVLYGYFSKGLANVNGYPIPWTKLGRSGERLLENTPPKTPFKHSLFPYITHCAVALGSNDLSQVASGLTYEVLKARFVARFTSLLRAGVVPVGVTIIPRVTSSDAYATLAGQTILNNDVGTWGAGGLREQINTWLRNGADGLIAGLIDISAVVSDPTDPTKFKVTGAANYATADGVHMSEAMHILCAPLVTAEAVRLSA